MGNWKSVRALMLLRPNVTNRQAWVRSRWRAQFDYSFIDHCLSKSSIIRIVLAYGFDTADKIQCADKAIQRSKAPKSARMNRKLLFVRDINVSCHNSHTQNINNERFLLLLSLLFFGWWLIQKMRKETIKQINRRLSSSAVQVKLGSSVWGAALRFVGGHSLHPQLTLKHLHYVISIVVKHRLFAHKTCNQNNWNKSILNLRAAFDKAKHLNLSPNRSAVIELLCIQQNDPPQALTISASNCKAIWAPCLGMDIERWGRKE